MIYSFNKYLVSLLTSVFVFVIVYRCFDEITSLVGSEIDDKLPEEKRKFVAVLSKNNEIKMVYIDNDNMNDIQQLSNEHPIDIAYASGDVISGAPISSYYQSSSVGIENPYSIEWDETIDYDYYENHRLNESKRSTDLRDEPAKNTIVVVQERYHSNDSITNIMYRYGDLNQLTFALPKQSTFQKYRPLRFHSSFVDTSLAFSSHVDMLINPTYRHETLRRFMPKDTVFIAVLHDPVTSFFSKLIKHPLLRKYTLKKRLKIIKTLVKSNKIFGYKYINSIASQFGYPRKHENHNLTSKEMVDKLKIQFDIVLMGDYSDESLVVLKNFLNWSITDLVYISRKENVDYGNIPSQVQEAIKEHNKLDQAIYEHFNNTFWKIVESHGSTFYSDLRELRNLNRKLTNYCKGHFGNTRSTEGDTICTRMKWGDEEYVSYLKAKYQVMSTPELNSGLQYLKNSLEFYFNTTSKEIQRYLEN